MISLRCFNSFQFRRGFRGRSTTLVVDTAKFRGTTRFSFAGIIARSLNIAVTRDSSRSDPVGQGETTERAPIYGDVYPEIAASSQQPAAAAAEGIAGLRP